jgi:predicted N-acetyltransferase YhbS
VILREAVQSEFDKINYMGFIEWAKGRTYGQYVKDNQQEEDHGTRFVYVNDEDSIIGSMIVLCLDMKILGKHHTVFGLGSIVIDENWKGKGYGKAMLTEYFSSFPLNDKKTIFMLYSDIQPHLYEKFKFRKLPSHQQRYPNSICMVRCCNHNLFDATSRLPRSQIPTYF